MVRSLHQLFNNHQLTRMAHSGLLIASILLLLVFQQLDNSAGAMLCKLPVASRFCDSPTPLILPSPVSNTPKKAGNRQDGSGINLPDYGRLVSFQQTFEEILEPLSGGALALSLQFSEIVLHDLSIAVEYSELPGKLDLTGHINNFIIEAKAAESGLRKLGSEVGSVVDKFVS